MTEEERQTDSAKDKLENATEFLEVLENDDDVQRVYANLKIGDN